MLIPWRTINTIIIVCILSGALKEKECLILTNMHGIQLFVIFPWGTINTFIIVCVLSGAHKEKERLNSLTNMEYNCLYEISLLYY